MQVLNVLVREAGGVLGFQWVGWLLDQGRRGRLVVLYTKGLLGLHRG